MKTLHALVIGLTGMAIQSGHLHSGEKPAAKDYLEYAGRVAAKEFVTIQPEVTGYLEKVLFRDGEMVKMGDVLFKIDSRQIEAELDAAKAKVVLGEAREKQARESYERASTLFASKSISREEFDNARSAATQAAAEVELDRAKLKAVDLELGRTVIRSPISGRVGRAYLSVGNLVKRHETKLTTVVSLDEMHVYFDMDERAYLRLRRAAKESTVVPVLLKLPDEEHFPHRGKIDFVDSEVVAGKGIAVRAIFANPRTEGGVALMAPGMLVRVRLPIGPAAVEK